MGGCKEFCGRPRSEGVEITGKKSERMRRMTLAVKGLVHELTMRNVSGTAQKNSLMGVISGSRFGLGRQSRPCGVSSKLLQTLPSIVLRRD